MYLLAIFGGHKSCENEDTNSYSNCYMNTSVKAQFTASVHHIERFSKSGIWFYNSEVLDTAGKKQEKEEEHRPL